MSAQRGGRNRAERSGGEQGMRVFDRARAAETGNSDTNLLIGDRNRARSMRAPRSYRSR
jgi:hypothetical protein